MASTYNYQSAPSADVEANKPPPYSSTYYYGSEPPPPPPQDYGPTQPLMNDTSSDDAGTTAFSEKSVRAGFIRKVYSILFGQLLVTIGIVCLFVFHKPTGHYVRTHIGMFYAAWVVTIIVMIAIACCEKVRRSFPTNFIMLSIFTLAEGYLLGVISAHYNITDVLMAMGIVAVVVLAITIFAFQTKWDFTMMGGCLFVALIVLLVFGFLSIFFYSRILHLVYACLGALIFALYLVFDTQIMMGGGKKYSLSPEEYIFAALNLYLDIVMLFMYILQIIGLARGD